MPWVRCAITNVFFKGDRTSVLFSKSNKPLFRAWPRGQGSKELCGTGEILSGLCRHQVATKRVLPIAYCVIDADYNNLTIRRTQCVINAKSPVAYCVINNNNLTICCTQCVISAQSPICVINAEYHSLTSYSTQCVINAHSPNAYCAINAQYTIHNMPPIRVAEVGSLSARAKKPQSFFVWRIFGYFPKCVV